MRSGVHSRMDTTAVDTIHLDVMNKQCTHQRAFLNRVPYGCVDCPWHGRYPHLNASFLEDQPWLPKYWQVVREQYFLRDARPVDRVAGCPSDGG